MPKQHITTFCTTITCEFCPKIYIDESKPAAKQIEINDDYGGRVLMSKEQLWAFADQARDGNFDEI